MLRGAALVLCVRLDGASLLLRLVWAVVARSPSFFRSYSRVNGLKIHNQWLKIMRLAKVESLRKDIEILSQSHEREVDRKDAIIQMLDKDLEARTCSY